MKKIVTLVILGIFFQPSVKSQIFDPKTDINVYFNTPVDNSVAHGANAIYLPNSTIGDTMIAYINRAKYSLDFCYFDFTEDSAWFEEGYVPPIHKAITAAYNRGVKIRWISNNIDSSSGFCNAFTPNYSLDSIPASIPKINRPYSSFAVMHNKFIIIDGKSTNPSDPIVWGGSMNIEAGQLSYDINNVMIIQDSGVAHAYTTEFNQIWGDTVLGGPSVVANQKWGSAKKDLSLHHFLVGANKIPVEAYFSPENNDNSQILATMTAATSEIDVCMYAFSYALDADSMLAAHKRGIYVSCIIDDQYSGDSPYGMLKPVLDSLMQLYPEGSKTNPTCQDAVPIRLCHSKLMITDPCYWSNPNSHPTVETGSHNWSSSANTVNDENFFIVHDSTIANLYYQNYVATFRDAQLANGIANPTKLMQCPTNTVGLNELQATNSEINVYPNPANSQLNVSISNIQVQGKETPYFVYNLMGQVILNGTLKMDALNKIDISSLPDGMYMLTVQDRNNRYSKKFSCVKN
jgi:phosphatidylserine/phosphatidylglycerophosphate/cardiolipin synthase-like enzyme